MVSFFYKSKKLRVRVAALIENDAGEILLLKQKKKKKDYWLLPGGGIEFGESAINALERELLEELNIQIEKPEFLLLNENIDPNGGRHLIQLVFSAKIKSGEPVLPKKDKIILDFQYFSRANLESIEIRPDIKTYLLSNDTRTNSVYLKSEWINE
ncbi:MAG: NUDIX hydrolase [Leptospiraceae bacterium]|nr:NUDIX hydrolase [Leptospiraceae bacterium]